MRKPTFKQIGWIIGGAAAGFAWYYFVGCTTGSCPISSNPYISTAYGALVGTLASGTFSTVRKQKGD
jgi:uncharacterized membrane protein YedE/YeeE